jgi:hypothetical protein
MSAKIIGFGRVDFVAEQALSAVSHWVLFGDIPAALS